MNNKKNSTTKFSKFPPEGSYELEARVETAAPVTNKSGSRGVSIRYRSGEVFIYDNFVFYKLDGSENPVGFDIFKRRLMDLGLTSTDINNLPEYGTHNYEEALAQLIGTPIILICVDEEFNGRTRPRVCGTYYVATEAPTKTTTTAKRR